MLFFFPLSIFFAFVEFVALFDFERLFESPPRRLLLGPNFFIHTPSSSYYFCPPLQPVPPIFSSFGELWRVFHRCSVVSSSLLLFPQPRTSLFQPFSFLSVELPGVTAAPRALGGVELLLFHPDAEVSAAPSLVTDKDIFFRVV